jgi:hypothetical protein
MLPANIFQPILSGELLVDQQVFDEAAVPADFNPYSEWLGLTTAGTPNHYELLSLPLFETDRQRIIAAAERATTRVRGFRPGSNAGAWSQLLDQIRAAKTCLSDPYKKAAYDRALQGGTPRAAAADAQPALPPSALAALQSELYPPGMEAPSGAPASQPETQDADSSEPVLHVSRQVQPQLYELNPPGSGAPLVAARERAARSQVPAGVPADVDPMAPVFTPVAEPLEAAAPMEAIVLPNAEGSPFAQQSGGGWQFGAAAPASVVGAGRRRGSPIALLLVGVGGGVLLAALVVMLIANQRRSETTAVVRAPEDTAGMQTEAANPEVAPMPEAVAPRSPTLPAPEMDRAAPSSSPPMPKPAEPAPQPAPPPVPTPRVTRSEVEALIKSLERAKAALSEQNFDVADQELATAGSLARLPKHQKAVDRLKDVTGYVKQFRQAVVAAIAGMQAGESFQVGSSTQVAFVSGSANEVTLRIAGSNRRFALSDLPPQLALDLSDFKLASNNPTSRVVKGAYLLVHKQPDAELKQKELERAQTLWDEAVKEGADIEYLMPFLTDNYAEFLKDATDGK